MKLSNKVRRKLEEEFIAAFDNAIAVSVYTVEDDRISTIQRNRLYRWRMSNKPIRLADALAYLAVAWMEH